MARRPSKLLRFRQGEGELRFTATNLIVAGYTGRDPEAVKAHVAELERHGIAPPPRIPMLFKADPRTLQLGGTIWAHDGSSSGEIEYVLLIGPEETYVCLGSDHTDRGLETVALTRSKQVYPRPLSREAWSLDALRDGWDHLRLSSRVGAGRRLDRYQDGTLGQLIHPDELLKLLGPSPEPGTVIFSGTLPVIGGQIRHDPAFEGTLMQADGTPLASLSYTTRLLA